MVFYSMEPTCFLLGSEFQILVEITMKNCRKNYPNCVWHDPAEWQSLNYYSALLIKVYWSYSTNTFRVCATSFHPTNCKLSIEKKANKQDHFGSKAMAIFLKFYASIFSHDLTLYSENYLLISLPVFHHIILCTLSLNVLRTNP